MFKENIMKKIAGLALVGVLAMPGVVNAATFATEPLNASGDTCTASSVEQLEDCVSGIERMVTVTSVGADSVPRDFSNVKKVVISGDITMESGLPVKNIEIVVNTGKTLTVTNGATLALSGTSKITSSNGYVVVEENSTLKVESTAMTAIDGPVTVKDSKLIVSNGSVANLTVNGTSTVDVKKVTGTVKIDGKGETTFNATEVAKTLTVNGNKSVKVNVPGEIAGPITVDNLNADVRIAAVNSDLTGYTAGIVRKATNDNTVNVLAKGITSVNLESSNEVLAITDKDYAKTLTVTGTGKIDNKTGEDITVKSINGTAKVVISRDAFGDNAYVVGNATQTPNEQPGNTAQTPNGDVTVPNNPATGDSIMSYVTLALTSVASLGLAVKKFLF